MTHGAWNGPSSTANTQVSLVTTEGDSESVVKSVVKLPPIMAGMDRAEALAFVSCLYDSAQAGAHIWGDALLVKRFLTQCSRTGSQETRDGYRREVRRFMRWRDRNHPDLHLREIDPSLAQDWVDELRREVEAERMKPRTFNRRVAAISSLYRWASDPSRSAVSGVPRNPIPGRSQLHPEKSIHALSDDQMWLLTVAIARAAHLERNAKRYYALVRGSYLLGCRVSEIAAIRWQDIEVLSDGGQIHLLGNGSKLRVVRVSSDTLALFEGLGRGEAEAYVFPSPRGKGHLTRQAIGDVCRKWGQAAGFHVHPHQLRHSHATHAVQRGVDVFTLQATLGDSSSATTGHYVASNPRDSSYLRLG